MGGKVDGTMADVAKVLEDHYPSGAVERYGWFGHPDRAKGGRGPNECDGGCASGTSDRPDAR